MLDVDVVVTGHNCSETLRATLESVLASEYTRGKVRLYYVDQASSDNSVEVARAFQDCTIVEILTDPLSDNTGWQEGGGALIQFLQSGDILEPQWLQMATKEMKPGDSGVVGGIKTLGAEGGYWSWVARVEAEPSPLMRRSALTKEKRARRIDALMLKRRETPQSFTTWWKRAMEKGAPQWRGPIVCLLLILSFWFWPFFFCAIFLLLYPRIFEIHKIERELSLSHHDAARYAWQSGFAAIPQFIGFLLRRFGRKTKNR